LDDDVGSNQNSDRDYSHLKKNQFGFLKVVKCVESKTLNLLRNSETMVILDTATTLGMNTMAKDKLQLVQPNPPSTTGKKKKVKGSKNR
jgi:hypothetical protein